MTEKKKTLGQVATEAFASDTGFVKVRDIGDEMLRDYMEEVFNCVEEAKKQIIDQDFYIEVLSKREILFSNVIRTYYKPRYSCPTPHIEQSVFKYNHKDETVSYIWTVPDLETCYELLTYSPPEEEELTRMVVAFFRGELLKYAMKENGEHETNGAQLILLGEQDAR